MNKICPNCQTEYDESHGFCSCCGARLIDKIDEIDPWINFGDANAISGGVNIDRSKNITSHDTHYHSTTVHERAKSDSELRLEATNQLRYKAEEIITERGRIDSVAMSQLRPFASQLGIDDETFKTIIKEVRSNRNGGAFGLGAANARYLQQAQQAVQTNDMDGLSNLTPRLEAMAAISQDDNVQYLYYLTLSLLYPIKSMEVYEHQTDENYWRSFWAIISYIRTGKYAEATKVLALFDSVRFEKSEDDQNLLEAYFNIMKEENDGAQEFLDEILGEPSEQIKPLLRAIEATLYEEDPDSLEVRFYFERVLSKSDVVIKTSKKVEIAPSVDEVVLPAYKEEKKAVNTINTDDNNTLPKSDNNIQAETMYSEACAASGAKRVMLLQKAADAGSRDAMYDLSDCYIDGEGVEKNEELAVKWLTKAADLDHPLAQTILGVGYFVGQLGLEQNYALSEKYLKMGADKNIIDAQAYLSQLYVHMEEYSQAMVWARKAAQASSQEAYSILGDIYLNGLGVESNPSEALTWYEKAAKEGDAKAQNIVGNLYSDNELNLLDLNKAFEYYQMAAAQNHLYGMFNFGLCYATGGGCEVDMLKAREWIEKSAKEGCLDAQEWLDGYYSTQNESQCNTIDERNMTSDEEIDYAKVAFENNDISKAEESFEIIEKYARLGIARAQNIFGMFYENGFGVKQDYFEAETWYEKAVYQGLSAAKYNLGLYKRRQDEKQEGDSLIKLAASENYPNAKIWIDKQNALFDSSNKQIFPIDNVEISTDGIGKLYVDISNKDKDYISELYEFSPFDSIYLEVSCVGFENKIKCRTQIEPFCENVVKERFKFDSFELDLDTNKSNSKEFKIKVIGYSFDSRGETEKEQILASKNITCEIWYEFHMFHKNKFEVKNIK